MAANNQDTVNSHEYFLYDSVKTYFSLEVFLLELLVQVCYPYFNWYWPIAHRHQICEPDIGTQMTVIPTAIFVHAAVLSYIMIPTLRGDIAFPLLFFLIHRVMIALKYASLSPTEYRRLMTCKNIKVVIKYQKQIQLISGWLLEDKLVVEFEVFSAAARLGLNIDSLHFVLPDENESADDAHMELFLTHCADSMTPLEHWKLFLHINIPGFHFAPYIEDERGARLKVSVHDVVRALVHRSREMVYYKSSNFFQALSVSVLIAIVPILMTPQKISTLWRVMFYISATWTTAVFFFISVHFLLTAVLDARRKLLLAKALSKFIRPTQHDLDTELNMGLTGQSFRPHPKCKVADRLVQVSDIRDRIKPAMDVDAPIGPNERRLVFLDKKRSSVFPLPIPSDDVPDKKTSVGGEKEFVDLENPNNGQETSNRKYFSTGPAEEKAAESEESIHRAPLHRKELLSVANIAIANTMQRAGSAVLNALGDSEEREREALDIFPKIDVQVPQNIYAWLYTRQVLQKFGTRQTFRLSIYVGAFIIILLALMMGLILVLFVQENPLMFAASPIFVQTCLAVIITMGLIIKLIFLGSLTNEEYENHRELLIQNAMRCEAQLSELLTEINTPIEKCDQREKREEKIVVTSDESKSGAQVDKEEKSKSSKGRVSLIDGTEPVASDRRESMSGTTGEDEPASDEVKLFAQIEEYICRHADIPSEFPRDRRGEGNDLEKRKHMMSCLFKLEESVKAQRRAIESITISNQQSPEKVLGVRAQPALAFSLLSSGGAFAIAMIQALQSNTRLIKDI